MASSMLRSLAIDYIVQLLASAQPIVSMSTLIINIESAEVEYYNMGLHTTTGSLAELTCCALLQTRK